MQKRLILTINILAGLCLFMAGLLVSSFLSPKRVQANPNDTVGISCINVSDKAVCYGVKENGSATKLYTFD